MEKSRNQDLRVFAAICGGFAGHLRRFCGKNWSWFFAISCHRGIMISLRGIMITQRSIMITIGHNDLNLRAILITLRGILI